MLRLGLIGVALSLFSGGINEPPKYYEEPISSEVEEEIEDTTVVDPISSSEETPVEDTTVVEPEPEEPKEPVEETFECSVVQKVYHIDENTEEKIEDANNKYGDIYLSLEKGHVGDECVAIVSSNPTLDVKSTSVYLYKYIVQSVLVNGAVISPSNAAKGEYTFTLIEGVNTVEVIFKGRAEISMLDLASSNWKALLTVDNLLKLIVLAVLLFVSSGFFITLIKTKKYKSKASEEIANKLDIKAQSLISTNTNKFLNETVKPLLEKQSEQTSDANETAKALMRVALLSQENTPEARLAIVNELQNYKSSDKELAEKVQEIVNNAIKENEEQAKKKAEQLQSVKDSVEELKEIEATETEEDEYGKL